MNKLLLTLLFSLSGSALIYAQENTGESYFYDLRGMEDSLGTTHLFYRYYNEVGSTCAQYDSETDEYNEVNVDYTFNNIFHYNSQTRTDSLQIKNYGGKDNFCQNEGVYTGDMEFFEAHPDSFITYTVYSGFEAIATITDLKKRYFYLGLSSVSSKINFDAVNRRFLFGYRFFWKDTEYTSLSIPKNSDYWQEEFIGTEENIDSLIYPFIVYDIDPYTNKYIAHRKDTLFSFNTSDSSLTKIQTPFDTNKTWDFEFFDDTTLIYASNPVQYNSFNPDRSLLKINTTQTNHSSVDSIRSGEYFEFAVDPENYEKLYLSDSLNILISSDFGHTFDHHLSLENEITGLYKKPGSDLLYVLTTEELLEVNVATDDITSLKQLPVSSEPEPEEIPAQTELHQNYPNPFNPSTTIRYQLHESGYVTLEVYDITGKKVASLVHDNFQSAGTHRVRFDANNLASGLYLYRLKTGDQTITQKMLLMK